MIKIAVCKYNLKEVDKLKKVLEKISAKANIIFDIFNFNDIKEICEYYKKDNIIFDIIFYEVEKNYINDFKCIENLKKDRIVKKVVLTSFSKEYVSKGSEIIADTYILKPIRSIELKKVLKNILKDMNTTIDKDIYIRNNGHIYTYGLIDAIYFESKLRKIIIHTKSEEIIDFYGNLNEIEQYLIKHKFLRVHNRYLINMRYIKNIKGGQVVLRNVELSISKKYMDKVNEEYNRYLEKRII